MFQTSSFDVWKKEQEMGKIITLCRDLDTHLEGGVGMRMVTEFCGAPGTGKTQMCLQLSINVQIPKHVGGLGGSALYVDTNQGFNAERLKEMATFMEQRVQQTLPKRRQNASNSTAISVVSILQNVNYIYCADYVELIATVEYIKMLIKEETLSQLKLLIIDSFSFPLRCIDDVTKRSRINYQILTDLQQLAFDNEFAVVITNELTTRIQDNESKICPALGDSHTHKINQRILLSRNNETMQRMAYIEKSLLTPRVGVPFAIKDSGIRSFP